MIHYFNREQVQASRWFRYCMVEDKTMRVVGLFHTRPTTATLPGFTVQKVGKWLKAQEG